MSKKITEIIVNWRPLPDGGEAFDKYTVGETVISGPAVVEITEHDHSAGFYYIVCFDNKKSIKVFNPNYVGYEEGKKNKFTNKKIK